LPQKELVLWIRNPQEVEKMIYEKNTKAGFSLLVGISPQALWHILSLKRSVKPTTAYVIAQLLGKAVSELFVNLPPDANMGKVTAPDKW
jgi:DNA-binding XRE family transcriptional regulator